MNLIDKHGNVAVTISIDGLREQQIFSGGQIWGDPHLVGRDITESTLSSIDIQGGDFRGKVAITGRATFWYKSIVVLGECGKNVGQLLST